VSGEDVKFTQPHSLLLDGDGVRQSLEFVSMSEVRCLFPM